MVVMALTNPMCEQIGGSDLIRGVPALALDTESALGFCPENGYLYLLELDAAKPSWPELMSFLYRT